MNLNNIAVILGAGFGKRMGNDILPKQFLTLSMKPIILLTLEKIINSSLFDKIILVIHKDWKIYTEEILSNYNINQQNIDICFGGKERLDSIVNTINYLDKNYNCNNSYIVFFDAVRPFISKKIISNAIKYAKLYNVAVAGVSPKDTVYTIDDSNTLGLLNRNQIVCGQAPDSFKYEILKQSIFALKEEDKLSLTGTIQICIKNGYQAYVYDGDDRNIKITTKNDYELAKIINKYWKD